MRMTGLDKGLASQVGADHSGIQVLGTYWPAFSIWRQLAAAVWFWACFDTGR